MLAVLAIAWIAGYPLSYAVLGVIRSPRPQRFRQPAVVWASVVVPACTVLVVVQPWLISVGAAYAALFAINVVYARRNDERALTNDGVFIVECALIVPVMWAIGSVAEADTTWPALPVPSDVLMLTTTCALVLMGSTLQVKSLIRERANPRYAQASKAFALACLPASLGLALVWGPPAGLWLMVPFVALAARALRCPRPQSRPGTIGLIELACFALTAVAAALALHA